MATSQTTLNRRLTLVINAPPREQESGRSRWTTQYEFKLWRFGAYQEVHTFDVGPDAIPFTLHTNLLRERCPSFYDELLQGGDTAAATPRLGTDISPGLADSPFDIRLLSVGLFRVFSAWLYTGQLVLPDEHAARRRPAIRLVAIQAHKVVEDAGSWRDEDLIDVYLFAARHELWELSNLALTRLWKQNDRHCRTTALPAIERAFAAGAFGWDDSLGGSGPNQKPYVMRLQDYLLFEGARRLHDIKDSLLDLLLTAHMFPPSYNRAVHNRYHEPSRAIEKRHENQPQPFWEYEPCYFHCHSSREEQQTCKSRCALPPHGAPDLPPAPPRPAIGPIIHRLMRGTCTVLLGRGQVPFTLHKELACYHSGFFHDTFGDPWHAPPHDKVYLPQEQPRDFAFFASWLYSGEICLPSTHEQRVGAHLGPQPRIPKSRRHGVAGSTGDSIIDVASDSDTSECTALGSIHELSDNDTANSDETTPARCAREPEAGRETIEARFLARKHQQDLIRLYTFAVRMEIPSLRNAVMDKLVEQRESGYPYVSSSPDNLRLAYQLNLPHSSLCSYLIQEAAFTFRGFPQDKSGYAQLLPPQFLHDLLEYQFTRGIFPKLKKHVPGWRVNLCDFHEHAMEKDATACSTRHLEWQEALRHKCSTWEPIRKEFQQRLATIRRLQRTPTPRGTPSQGSPAVANSPVPDTAIPLPSPSAFDRPAPGTPTLGSHRDSIMSRASTNRRSSTAIELQLTPQFKHGRSGTLRKDSAVNSLEITFSPTRPRRVSSCDVHATPPPTPIRTSRRSPGPPVPPKPPYEVLRALQRALPPVAPSKRHSHNISAPHSPTLNHCPSTESGPREPGHDILVDSQALDVVAAPVIAPNLTPPPPSPPLIETQPPQAKAIQFSGHRAAAMARVSRFANKRPFLSHSKSVVSRDRLGRGEPEV